MQGGELQKRRRLGGLCRFKESRIVWRCWQGAAIWLGAKHIRPTTGRGVKRHWGEKFSGGFNSYLPSVDITDRD